MNETERALVIAEAENRRLLAEVIKLTAEIECLRAERDRDPLCWSCFWNRNSSDGEDNYSERADAYVAACNCCGAELRG